MTPKAFLEEYYSSQPDSDGFRIMKMYKVFFEAFGNKQHAWCEEVLQFLDIQRINTTEMVAFLTITYAPLNQSEIRHKFFKDVMSCIAAIEGEKEAKEILQGLDVILGESEKELMKPFQDAGILPS